MSPRRKTLPTPLSPASVPLPPEPRGGGGAHPSAGEGLGESQLRRLKNKLNTLPTLWGGETNFNDISKLIPSSALHKNPGP